MTDFHILDSINSPEDLKRLPEDALPVLCAEIREELIRTVSKTGGHLASNLGVVELTVAIHRVFDTSSDRLIFDVGHQCYIHKILTGRRERMNTLRTFGGISGFPRPEESAHDAFIAGHASTSVSAALGMARARTLSNGSYNVVCITGDGALTGGLVYEALNDAGQSGEPMVVILNDNDMSIDPNVGGMARLLSGLRCKKRYLRAKEITKDFLGRTKCGQIAISGIRGAKSRLRKLIMSSVLFEQMGFYYLGPADGHDIETVERLLRYAVSLKRPVLLHVKTKKGKGYEFAEKNPELYHGVSSFDPQTGIVKQKSGKTFSEAFGDEICRLAENDPKICAVTAAMASGTSLSGFEARYPERFFDVGIAEAHAVTMSAAMAASGMKPVCAIYSTFMQRAYDSIVNDTAILHLPVVFAVDRAGIVGEDGETHNGVFDIPFLATVPRMTVYSPSSLAELRSMLKSALSENDGPCAVRYPRGREGAYKDDNSQGDAAVLRSGTDITLVSYGIMINEALEAAEMLEKKGISAEVVKLNRVLPLPEKPIIESVKKTSALISVEDVSYDGGVGMHIAAMLAANAVTPKSLILKSVGKTFLQMGAVNEMRMRCGIDAASIAEAAMEAVKK